MYILKFYADWCQPCKELSKKLETINVPWPITEIDVDTNQDAALEHGVRGIPCMIFFDENNNVLGRIAGNPPKEKLVEEITKYTTLTA